MVNAHPGKYSLRSSPKFCFRTAFISCLYKRLTKWLVSICKIFADDRSIFSKVFDKNSSQNILSNDLSIISEWAFQWKMQFNPDPNKQANEVYLSRKSNSGVYLPVDLNNSPVQLCESHKHLGIVLDNLNFHEHIAKKKKFVTN